MSTISYNVYEVIYEDFTEPNPTSTLLPGPVVGPFDIPAGGGQVGYTDIVWQDYVTTVETNGSGWPDYDREGASGILEGGPFYIYNGAVATGVTVKFGGELYVEGAVIEGIDDSGDVVFGPLTYPSTSDDTTIYNGGFEDVSDGGVADGTTVSGGQQIVDNFGSASNTFVTCEWITPNNSYYPGIQTINLDGSVNDTRVGFGGDVYVSSGGSLSDSVVSSGGLLEIESGAIIDNVTVLSGGELIVETWSDDLTIPAGGIFIDSGATIAYDLQSGVGVSNYAVDQTHSLIVEAGATASDIQIASSGFVDVEPGGFASGVTIGSGGWEYVASGGISVVETVESGGSLTLPFPIGVAVNPMSGVTLDDGGHVTFDVDSGQSITGFSVGSGVSILIEADASATGTVLSGGGSLDVWSGGSASGTIVDSGGYELVGPGGFESGAQVNSGGQLNLGGGQVSGVVVSSGGSVNISISSAYGAWTGGGTIDGVTLLPGARVDLTVESGGSISGFVASSGVDEDVFGGGSASGSIIDSGGYEDVGPGGFESGAQVNSGGQLNLGGGQVSGVVVSSGGSVNISISSAYGAWTGGGTIDGVTLLPGARVDLTVEFRRLDFRVCRRQRHQRRRLWRRVGVRLDHRQRRLRICRPRRLRERRPGQ